MSSPIDSSASGRTIRRTSRTGAQRPQSQRAASVATEVQNLPVPVGRARTVPRTSLGETDSAFAAHLLGQDGQKRGLRAGPALIEIARNQYNRTEWSGEWDRRAGAGRATRTKV